MAPFEEGGDGTWLDPKCAAAFAIDDSFVYIGINRNLNNFELRNSSIAYQVRKFGDRNFSVSRGNMKFKWGINRILFIDDIVTFVYSDGKVKMQLENCLKKEDATVVREIFSVRKLDSPNNQFKFIEDLLERLNKANKVQ